MVLGMINYIGSVINRRRSNKFGVSGVAPEAYQLISLSAYGNKIKE